MVDRMNDAFVGGALKMSLEGRVQDGTVVFNQPLLLPEGTRVRVELLPAEKVKGGNRQSLLERLGDVVGAIDDLPEDLASEHDHYLYGTPKRA